MKKSKFLKKSLAMLLAVMLVVAMIPLSAAAAVGDYTPVGAPTLAAGTGSSFSADPTVSGSTYTVNFNYEDGSEPDLTITTRGTAERIRYVVDGTYTTTNSSSVTINLTDDEDTAGVGNTFTFWVVKSDSEPDAISDAYTVNWTMGEASTEASVTSATLGTGDNKYTGVVDNAANTIKFTVPYGYKAANSGTVALDIKKTSTATITGGTTFTVANIKTNMTKGASESFTLAPEQGTNPETWTVTVEEADALTAISLGDVDGKIEIATADATNSGLTNGAYNKDYETGDITFNMPAGTKTETVNGEEQLMLVPTFTIGSAYTKVEIETASGTYKEVKSGEEFNFAYLYNNKSAKLKVTSPDNNSTYNREYVLKMVIDGTSTAITGFTVTDDDNFEATGTVNGTALSAQLSSEASLPGNVKIVFDVATNADVIIDSTTKTAANGKATFDSLAVTTQPITVKVISPDDSRQATYTLTITKAEDANKNPQITSGKLTIDKDSNDEAEYTASISGNTITFTVPYSTTKEDITPGTKGTEYTWAKTAQTKLSAINFVADSDGNYFGDKANNTIVVSSDGKDAVTYKVVFNKEAAQTGKSISDFILTQAGNTALVEYKTTYDVTASGTQFNITLPQSVINAAKTGTQKYNVNFTLSEGAKLYEVDSDVLKEVKVDIDTETGAFKAGSSQIDLVKFLTDGQKYVIADEYLAYEVTASSTLSGIQSTAKYDNHYTVYTVKATGTNRTGTALTSLSANDGLVTSTISGKKVTINVPYSYAQAGADPFFFDFTVSDGASLKAGTATLINGGDKQMSTDNKVENAPDNDTTNPAFTVAYNSADKKYELKLGATVISALTVVSENGMPVAYDVEVKVNPAETGAVLTSVKVGNTSATINNTAKTVTVSLPYGTNLGAQELTIEASKLAKVWVGSNLYTEPVTISLTRPVTITVQSENTATTNVYTLTATTAAQFSDVSTDDWFYQNVMDAVAAGIVSGRGDGTFGPNDRITRRDFAIMVSKLLLDGEDAPEATTTPFSDVSADDYALNAIAYCAENGIISGFDGEFRPSDNITRQEAASVMKNALELTGTTSELFADDAAIATWAKANVYACKAAGVFNGDDNNNFNPTSTLTRAEAASIMVNAMK